MLNLDVHEGYVPSGMYDNPSPESQIKIERAAWGIVLISFAAFCAIFAVSVIGVYYFFFESTVLMTPVARVGQGTVVVVNSDFNVDGVRLERRLDSLPTRLSTDSQSQSSVSFYLPPDPDRVLVATVTLRNDTSLSLRQSARPRFEWSQGRYLIEIQDLEGELDIFVMDLGLPVFIQITTTQGATIHLNGSGRYFVDASSSLVQLINFDGEAILFTRDPRTNRNTNSRLVPPEQEGIIYTTQDQPVVSPSRLNLIENSLFMFNDIAPDQRETAPLRWGCTNDQDNLPRGAYRYDTWDGQQVLRLVRGDGANSNGETRCIHPFAEPGFDVRQYNFLELDTSFLINYQSLSECGQRGSECPMMLHIEYVDVNGFTRDWYQGFYAVNNSQLDYPSRCESCIHGEHRQINEKAWYTYKTGNLFTILATNGLPAYIRRVEFYASGHQYDVLVSELSLYTGIAPVVPQSVAGSDSEASNAGVGQ